LIAVIGCGDDAPLDGWYRGVIDELEGPSRWAMRFGLLGQLNSISISIYEVRAIDS